MDTQHISSILDIILKIGEAAAANLLAHSDMQEIIAGLTTELKNVVKSNS